MWRCKKCLVGILKSVCAGLFWNILFIEMWHIYSLSGERMNRLECGLFQLTQNSCRCNIDGFQLIAVLYNSGKWEQNHMSFVYSFSLCICTFIGKSCSTCVSKYKQSCSVCCSLTHDLLSLLSRLLLGSCYAQCFIFTKISLFGTWECCLLSRGLQQNNT
jgi:hypothetical protein